MTAWVADYVSRIAPAALKAAGVVGVCRYLASSSGIGKIIEAAEYRELTAAGITVVLNWEQSEHDWLDGAVGGKADGTKAAAMARALGYPAGRPIPGSADFDMTAAQWNSAGKAYATAYRDAVHAGGYAAGVYGGWDVLTWCRDLGGYVMFWQSMSTGFSGGRNKNPWPGGHLLQHAGPTIAGQGVDRNDIRRPDWAGTAPPPEDDMLKDEAVPGTDAARTALNVVTDLENLRNWLVTPVGAATIGVPRAGSPLDMLVKSLTSPQAVTLTDEQLATLAAAVIAAHPALDDADKPVIVQAVQDALNTLHAG